MTLQILGFILLAVTLSAFAQLALKLGVSNQQIQSSLQNGISDALYAVALSPLIWLGLTIYVVSVGMWLWVLSKVELSVAYPFVGIGFILTMFLGASILNENVTPIRIIGTLLIAGGCILVGKSA